jgi:hypothetical protein
MYTMPVSRETRSTFVSLMLSVSPRGMRFFQIMVSFPSESVEDRESVVRQ